MSEWIDVTQGMPKPRQACLAVYTDYHGHKRITMAWHAPARFVDASDFSDEVECEYDEATDTMWLKEGWNDESQESEYHYGINDVTHWMPLPSPPPLISDAALREMGLEAIEDDSPIS